MKIFDNLYGTEQLADIVNAIIKAVEAGKGAIADGRFTVMDIMLAVPLASPLNSVIEGADATDDEFLDLTQAEVDGLVALTETKAIEAGLAGAALAYARYGAMVIFAIGGGLSVARAGRKED